MKLFKEFKSEKFGNIRLFICNERFYIHAVDIKLYSTINHYVHPDNYEFIEDFAELRLEDANTKREMKLTLDKLGYGEEEQEMKYKSFDEAVKVAMEKLSKEADELVAQGYNALDVKRVREHAEFVIAHDKDFLTAEINDLIEVEKPLKAMLEDKRFEQAIKGESDFAELLTELVALDVMAKNFEDEQSNSWDYPQDM